MSSVSGGGLATHAHTHQGGPGWPELRATALPDGLEDTSAPHLSLAHAHQRQHDYVYGASKASLRPTGPFPETPPPGTPPTETPPTETPVQDRSIPAPKPEPKPEPGDQKRKRALIEQIKRDQARRIRRAAARKRIEDQKRRIHTATQAVETIEPVSRNRTDFSAATMLADLLPDLLEGSS